MNEVIEKLCRIKTQYAINRLNPSSTDMIFIQYEELCLELNKQLQSYKQKEDKLREYIESNPAVYYDEYLLDVETLKSNEGKYDYVRDVNFISTILQILNEKSDKK